MAWLGMIFTLGFNYRQFKRGRWTMCMVTRRILPFWLFMIGWSIFNCWFVRHIKNGYPLKLKL